MSITRGDARPVDDLSSPGPVSRFPRVGGLGQGPAVALRVLSVVVLVLAIGLTIRSSSRPIEGDSRVYVEAAESVAHGDYRAPSEPSGVPRYPPGFPLILAPSVAIAGDAGARVTAIAIGAVLVASVWFAARELAGDLAATIAGLLWILSPMVRDYGTDVMSDPAAAALVVLGLIAVGRGRWMLAGLAWGCSSAVRLVHAAFLPALGRRRAGWLAAAAIVVPLAVFQVKVYGRLAGHDGSEAGFSLSYVLSRTPLVVMSRPSPWTNLEFFPGLLFGLGGGLVPGLPLFAAYEMWSRRSEAVARAAVWVVVANVAVYLPYYFQAARFMLPAACLVIVFAAAGVVNLLGSLSARRGAQMAAV